jgi:hypothetical protein
MIVRIFRQMWNAIRHFVTTHMKWLDLSCWA